MKRVKTVSYSDDVRTVNGDPVKRYTRYIAKAKGMIGIAHLRISDTAIFETDTFCYILDGKEVEFIKQYV